MTPQEFLEIDGEFTWLFGCDFFIETLIGNFIWSDKDYQGDNTLTYTSKTYEEFLKECSVPYGRSKGIHVIGDYIGREGVIFTKATIGKLSAL